MSEDKHLGVDSSAVQKHLEIMQGVIARMAENSRSCKLWCVTIVAAVLVLVARTDEAQNVLVALIPTALFLFLDSYYLALERAFRKSHETFVDELHGNKLRESEIFRVESTGMNWILVIGSLISTSVWPFYLLVVATILVARFWIL